jgi:hypothetical protein
VSKPGKNNCLYKYPYNGYWSSLSIKSRLLFFGRMWHNAHENKWTILDTFSHLFYGYSYFGKEKKKHANTHKDKPVFLEHDFNVYLDNSHSIVVTLSWTLYNRICGVMVSVLALSAVDRGFALRSGQTKDYKIGICCFSTKHAALRRKSKDWLTRNRDNVSKCGELLFQWASTIKIQLSVLA